MKPQSRNMWMTRPSPLDPQVHLEVAVCMNVDQYLMTQLINMNKPQSI